MTKLKRNTKTVGSPTPSAVASNHPIQLALFEAASTSEEGVVAKPNYQAVPITRHFVAIWQRAQDQMGIRDRENMQLKNENAGLRSSIDRMRSAIANS